MANTRTPKRKLVVKRNSKTRVIKNMRIDPEIVSSMEEIAYRQGSTFSQVMRQAAMTFIRQYPKPPK